MKRLLAAFALLLVAALAGGIALADSTDPVTLTTSVLSRAQVGAPLKVRVAVNADPGVLDVRSSPMELEARLAPECGGTYLDTPGTKLFARDLTPQPAYGRAYTAQITATAKPQQSGAQTVCVWLVSSGDQRLFADDDSVGVQVATAAKTKKKTKKKVRRRRASTARQAQVRAHDASGYQPPPIHHVFVIVLENESESTSFGASSPAPYLAKTLVSEGAFVPNYYGTGHNSNDNYISMISGQAPNAENQDDCVVFGDFAPGSPGAYGQEPGEGCVYPTDIPNIATQLDSAGLTWGDFDQSMGNDPTREASECGHPAVGSVDGTQSETATDAYATRHNPFVYFHSIIDDTKLCDTHVVNLEQLPSELASESTTPNYSFIVPDLCGDGHDATCSDSSRPGGLAGINQFLQQWVPQITSSPAYKDNGLLIVTFDEASSSDTSSCCGEIAGPGSPEPGISGPGGGKIGAVLLSPCIKPGTVSQTAYNHYTMLGSVENLFGLPHLGYAGLPGETYFGPDIYTNPSCGSSQSGTGKPTTPAKTVPVTRLSVHRTRVRFSSNVKGSTFTIEVRRTGRHATRWRIIRSRAKVASVVLRLKPGTYLVRVQAVSPAGVPGHFTTRRFTIRSKRR